MTTRTIDDLDVAAAETAAATPSDLFTTVPAHAGAEQFAERLMAGALGAMELSAVYLGDRLGWYRALADEGAMTSVELATVTGTAERYAREWLEHQAVSGFVEVLDETEPADRRRFRLHAGVAEVTTDVDSLAHVAPLARLFVATARVMEQLLDAYRTGGGVGWAELGADAREAQSLVNRPYFLHHLAQVSMPAVPELHALLRGGARVADVGCGEGWSAIGMALGYDDVEVDGFDVDGPSVDAARRHASTHAVADRVRFVHVDAAQAAVAPATYDVVTAFECVHDMTDPVAVLRSMRAMVSDDGYVLVVDEASALEFAAPAEPTERLFYGYSLLCCLPDGLHLPDGAGTGTVMRPSTLEEYARAAGFSGVEVLPVEHDVFRFYRLHL